MKRFNLLHLLSAVMLVALVLAATIEQQAVIGKSSTRSPDGNWSLNLELIENSTLFTSRRTLNATVAHKTNTSWDVSTSVPMDEADEQTISNQHAEFPIAWSTNSKKVTYWINQEMNDSIEIEANDEQLKFKRKLYDTSVTHTFKGKDNNLNP